MHRTSFDIRDSLFLHPTLPSASQVDGVDVQQHSTPDEMADLHREDPVTRRLPLNKPNSNVRMRVQWLRK
jgi:hypothetical protein